MKRTAFQGNRSHRMPFRLVLTRILLTHFDLGRGRTLFGMPAGGRINIQPRVPAGKE